MSDGWEPEFSSRPEFFISYILEMNFKEGLKSSLFSLIKALGWGGGGRTGMVMRNGIICMCLNDLDPLRLEGRRFFSLIRPEITSPKLRLPFFLVK